MYSYFAYSILILLPVPLPLHSTSCVLQGVKGLIGLTGAARDLGPKVSHMSTTSMY